MTEDEQISIAVAKKEEDIPKDDNETRRLRAIEKSRCRASFLYFLKYCKVVEAPTIDNQGGIIPLKLWEHLKKAVAVLLTIGRAHV